MIAVIIGQVILRDDKKVTYLGGVLLMSLLIRYLLVLPLSNLYQVNQRNGVTTCSLNPYTEMMGVVASVPAIDLLSF